MGLIKAGIGALGGTLADQWKEFFYCESLDADVLMAKGVKKSSKRSSNKRGEVDIITSGSGIAVADGQAMIIIEQGKIVEFCAEPGEYTYDASTEPSIFSGKLGESIIETFKTIGKRFTYGGDTAKDQRVYYFNLKEIVGNKYGTATPVPFRVVDRNIGLDIDISVRCNGEYSYKITDPLLFYKNVAGNVSDEYRRETIDGILKSELLTALQPAFAKISEMGIRYSAIPGHTLQLSGALNEILSEKWKNLRGIEISSFAVNSISASEEDEKLIKQLQQSAALRDPGMAAATLAGAQAQAMRDAANNTNAGPFMAFAGVNMAQNAGGISASELYKMSASAPKNETFNDKKWFCKCGAENSGKFCTECASPRPSDDKWICGCGTENKGKFCSECGSPRPTGFKCDKCGWEPEDPLKAPKFCPNCGDRFDESDKK